MLGNDIKFAMVYHAGYTVANLWRFPIRRSIAFPSAMYIIMHDLFVWFDSLRHSQQSFSYVGSTGDGSSWVEPVLS